MKIFRWLVLLVPMATTSCHAAWTGPVLWGHDSSAAFEAWIVIWIINFIFIYLVFCKLKNNKGE